ncbi:MAG: DEAD/DEAH box helicase [Candidatus Marsarchaeota archaeon]|jgi:ATP-dependent RNA helicase DeaD|nr:DEAD/DEAH box helicase [Candidatus Marsarchaeota archaeon]MCL5419244.1 DEAD/DEAH box helicase [Candidatus Marsarchaeota archaeon]
METFSELGINSELVAKLNAIGFVSPTEVQAAAIPPIMQGKDVIVRSKTGSGKTGAFLVPIINGARHGDSIYALIIVPTRELALQVTSVASKLCTGSLRVATVYGGASINVQVQQIRNGANIIVGTPGRLLDLYERGALYLEKVRYLVLDEADIMLDMGFIDDIEEIISKLGSNRQTMLFSATMPREIQTIASRHMNSTRTSIEVGSEDDLTVNTIAHKYAVVSNNAKFAALLAYIDEHKPKKAIIFTNTKYEADKIHSLLRSSGMNAILMHGGLTQAKREYSLHMFRGNAQFLISTNLASRGLDIVSVTDIINFDVPDVATVYIHRTGRTARLGREGVAFTIATPQELNMIRDIEYKANIRMERINVETGKFEQAVRNALAHGQHGSYMGHSRFHGYGQRDEGHAGSRDRRFRDRSGFHRRPRHTEFRP